MIDAAVREKNRQYWDGAADNWFGATALPEYGVHCVTEDELHFFDGVQGKRMLEVGCGSGHSLVWQAKHGAGELWGLDISESQLRNYSISDYVNALADAGFAIERLVEQTDAETLAASGDLTDKMRQAQMHPLSFVFKARKL